jgi:hypothetical protein
MEIQPAPLYLKFWVITKKVMLTLTGRNKQNPDLRNVRSGTYTFRRPSLIVKNRKYNPRRKNGALPRKSDNLHWYRLSPTAQFSGVTRIIVDGKLHARAAAEALISMLHFLT